LFEQAEAQAAEREAARQRNRERMPVTAATMDAFREAFGNGVRLVWACEDGIEVGRRSHG
jgi:hypothetical protein